MQSGSSYYNRAASQKQIGRANRRIGKIWNKVSPSLGLKGASTPPTVNHLSPSAGTNPNTPVASAFMQRESNGTKSINFSPLATRRLARKGGRNIDKNTRMGATETFLHELAHYYQGDQLLLDRNAREGLAEQWSQKQARNIYGKRASNLSQGYIPQKKYAKQTYGKHYFKQAQFGSNYGKAPSDIRWDTSATVSSKPSQPRSSSYRPARRAPRPRRLR